MTAVVEPSIASGPASGRGREARTHTVAAILLAVLGLRVYLAATVPLMEAEAYYWRWAQDPAWSYADHPPMIAWAIGLTTAVFGDSQLGIRAAPLILGTLGTLLLYRLYRRLTDRASALVALAVTSVAPFWLPFGVLATPDAPLLCLWTAGLLLFLRAFREDRLLPWIAAGAATGLTILSKYNGVQLPVVFLVFLLLSDRGRGLLRGRGPWLAVLVALVIAAPNLWWNSQHGGDTAQTAFSDEFVPADTLRNVGLFLALPIGLLTPLVCAAWVRRTWTDLRAGRHRTDPRFVFACCATLVPLAAFAAVALVTEVHVHWIATCLVLAVPIALDGAGRTSLARGPGPRFRKVAAVSVLLFPISVVGAFLAVPQLARPPEDPRHPDGPTRAAMALDGWSSLEERLDREVTDRGSDGRLFLASQNFHLASTMEWLVRMRAPAFPIRRRHLNQYRYWSDETDFKGWDALYVAKYPASELRRRNEAWRLGRSFRTVERLEPITAVVGGVEVPRFEVYHCRHFRRLTGKPRAVGRHDGD